MLELVGSKVSGFVEFAVWRGGMLCGAEQAWDRASCKWSRLDSADVAQNFTDQSR